MKLALPFATLLPTLAFLFGSFVQAQDEAVIDAGLAAELLRSAPFVVFAKRAPSTLPEYNEDTDFTYFYFSDAMQRESGIFPSFLAPDRNAKSDFPPEDYPGYFNDDVAVCMDYPFPRIKVITEPWGTPATTTVVETRKTSVTIADQLYMLGWFAPHDDVELGLTAFKAGQPPAPLEMLGHVPEEWYPQAFEQLPVAVRVVNIEGVVTGGAATTPVVAENKLARESFLDQDTMRHCFNVMEGSSAAGASYGAFEFGDQLWNGKPCRIWAWRVGDDGTVAFAVREKHDGTPSLVQSSLGSGVCTRQETSNAHGFFVQLGALSYHVLYLVIVLSL